MRENEENFTFTVSLALTAHSLAEKFRRHQANPQKAKQVYLNTLAVYAVNYYLECMGFETDLCASDSWNPVMQTLMDVADLEVKDYGKIECRVVLSNSQICHVPAEVWSERIAYVVVQLNESLREATLLGFVETVEGEELPLSELRSLEDFLKKIELLGKRPVNLTQWFENIFDASWQTLEKVFNPQPTIPISTENNAVPSKIGRWFQGVFETSWRTVEDAVNPEINQRIQFRGASSSEPKELSAFHSGKINTHLFPQAGVTRAKVIDLGMQLGKDAIALLVSITQDIDEKVSIIVQIHPASGKKYLPSALRLALVSDLGENLQQVESRTQDICIQLRQFKVLPDTIFKIQVTHEDVNITETFAI